MIYNYGANELCTDVHPKPACTQTRLAANRNHKVKLGKQLSVRSSFNLTLQLQREGSSGPFWVSCLYVHTHSVTWVEMTAVLCLQRTERAALQAEALVVMQQQTCLNYLFLPTV